MSAPDLKQASVFLQLLFGAVQGWIDVRLMKPDTKGAKREPLATMSEALDVIAKNEAANAYVGLATRATGSKQRGAGGKENLLATRALWVDVDELPPGDRRERYLAETLPLCGIPPSFVVDSGGGLHIYWLLEEPTSLATEAERDHFECILRGLCEVLDGDRAATDSSRILRVAGTMNYPDERKRAKGRTAVPCTMLQADNGRSYQLADFEDFAERGQKLHAEKAERVVLNAGTWDGKLPASVTAAIERKRNAKLRERWQDPDEQGDRASELDQGVANYLALEGVKAESIGHALRFRRQRTDARPKHEGYYDLTVGKALAWGKAERTKEKPVPELEILEGGKAAEPEHDGSDYGVAAWTLLNHGEDLLYHPKAGWLVWDGTRFSRETKEAHRVRMITSGAADELFQSSHELQARGNTEEARTKLKQADKARQMRTLRDAVTQMEHMHRGGHKAGNKPDTWVEPTDLDASAYLFNVSNGTLNISKDEAILKPHERSDRITRIAPFGYDAQAECPRWLKWLEEFQPDEETRRYLQKLTGQSLLGEPNKFVLAIHYGMGANGKSTFVNIVRSVIGDEYAVEAASDLLAYSGKQAGDLVRLAVNLPGARLAVTSEPAEGCCLNSAAVKRITSGDPMQGRWLYKEAFPFVPVCTVMMTTNHRPVVAESDDGIWRRLHLVPWQVTITPTKMDRRFHLKLVEAEGPGILRWMVEGAQAYLTEGLELPEQLAEATEDYREEADEVGAFLADWCTFGDMLSEAGSVIHKAFLEWTLENGGDTKLANNSFAERLKRHGLSKGKGRDRRRWIGVQLTPAACEVLEQNHR